MVDLLIGFSVGIFLFVLIFVAFGDFTFGDE